MSSLISGFEYDIFISYRQKDNRGDHWVTEFVNALKSELDATFKEDISIYFDENPHDGLLETHDVDKSLENKLKCLIFIPIISQTYCDPKSFAWKSEFLAFKKIASEDALGLKIKLHNGNVGSRILPVRIHELDEEDKSVLENEIGPLRSVDFIFKSAGVNRPLRMRDDETKEITHTVFYRDQVNKVANAVKELINSIKSPGVAANNLSLNVKPISPLRRKRLAIIASVILLIGVVASGTFYFSGLNEKIKNANQANSIAVLPFDNISNDPEQDYFCDGTTEEIRSQLSILGTLKVISRITSVKIKETKLTAKEIVEQLGVSHILDGSVQKSGTKIKVTVQLIDAATDNHLWSETYEEELTDVFAIERKIANEVAKQFDLKLRAGIQENLTKPTQNSMAHEYYLKGRSFWNLRSKESYDSAESYFKRAIEIDPQYALAYSGLADCYTFNTKGMNQTDAIPIARSYALKALQLDSNLCEAITTIGFIQSHFDYSWEKASTSLQKAIMCNPNYPQAHVYLTNIKAVHGDKSALNEVDKALELDPLNPTINWVKGRANYSFHEFELCKTQLANAINLNPKFSLARTTLALACISTGELAKAKEVIDKMPDVFPNLENKLLFQGILNAHLGNRKQAESEIAQAIDKFENISYYRVAQIYLALGDKNKAIENLEKAFSLRDINLLLINDPPFDALQSDSRFKALLQKMNLKKIE